MWISKGSYGSRRTAESVADSIREADHAVWTRIVYTAAGNHVIQVWSAPEQPGDPDARQWKERKAMKARRKAGN